MPFQKCHRHQVKAKAETIHSPLELSFSWAYCHILVLSTMSTLVCEHSHSIEAMLTKQFTCNKPDILLVLERYFVPHSRRGDRGHQCSLLPTRHLVKAPQIRKESAKKNSSCLQINSYEHSNHSFIFFLTHQPLSVKILFHPGHDIQWV